MAGPTLTPLSPKLSELALKRFIEAFLDPERMAHSTYLMLEKLRRNKGYRGSGFPLWNYLQTTKRLRPYMISEQTFKSYTHKLSEVLVYWDSTYLEPDSPYAGKSGIWSTSYTELVAELDLAPPTLYLFDRDFRWTLIRTDEAQNDLGWNCLQLGEIGGAASRKLTSAPSAAPADQVAGNVVLLKRQQPNRPD